MEKAGEQKKQEKRSFREWMKLVWHWIYLLRQVWLALPVLAGAIVLAVRNAGALPESVGINLLENGEYQWMISRTTAVWAPLGITVLCLLLMLISKKYIYPWLIGLFSLAVPLVIWIINVFPA